MIWMNSVGSSLSIWPKAKNANRRSGKFARCWRFGIALCLATFLNLDSAKSLPHYKPNHYKQYIYISLKYNSEQTYCLIDLYHHESRFNPEARNGSHHGIPQGRSKYLATVGGIKQIEWGKRYIGHRYGWIDEKAGIPDACKALQHWAKKGWH